MATFATDSSDAEKGPTRSGTFDTLVPEQDIPLQPLSQSPPTSSNATQESLDATASPTSTGTRKRLDWKKARTLNDGSRYPAGYPRLAEQQTRVHNGGIHRRFEIVNERLTADWECQTTLLEERLYELDMKSPETGKRLSAGQKAMGETSEVEEYDLVREQLEQAYFRYHRLVMAQKDMRRLLSVHPEEVRGLYSFLDSQGMTDSDAFAPAYAPRHDYGSTALVQTHRPVRGLLYSPLGEWLQDKLPCFLKVREDIGGIPLSETGLSLALRVVQVFFSSSLILIPIGALLFGDLDKRAMFGVVVASVFVFSAVVVLGAGERGESGGSGHGNGLLHGVVAAYTAVLATFLAQLGS